MSLLTFFLRRGKRKDPTTIVLSTKNIVIQSYVPTVTWTETTVSVSVELPRRELRFSSYDPIIFYTENYSVILNSSRLEVLRKALVIKIDYRELFEFRFECQERTYEFSAEEKQINFSSRVYNSIQESSHRIFNFINSIIHRE